MNTRLFFGIVTRSLLFFISIQFTEGGKLLVIPHDGSHWLSMRGLVDKLSEKGHQIVIFVPDVNFHMKNLDQYTVITLQATYSKELMESLIKKFSYDMFERRTILENIQMTYQGMVNMSNLIISSCENLLKNETLIKYLEKSHFDALLSDPMFPCGEIIGEHLAIPSVFFMRGVLFSVDLDAAQVLSPPSYVPRMFTTYTDHMTFKQRLVNFLLASIQPIASKIFYAPFVRVASEFLRRDVTILDLFSRASILLLRGDFIFDFPRPIMPNMIFIGGINCANKKLLDKGKA
ncbi:UDP-glucuronosyltransferase 1A1-like [Leptodactylus fuscus]|uniref:UDP-glucuronosyltransferase 1A1-like n=1 Tax=Leptodactylus fuscus TaxID=238119 RepID=UPI003F4F019B